MSLLVESIWISGRTVMKASYHQQRYAASLHQLYPHAKEENLLDHIEVDLCTSFDTKCRIIYSDKIEKVDYTPYQRKTIKSAKIVVDDKVTYALKYEARPQLDALYKQRNGSDEIVIVKNDLVTDGYYYNLVFEDDFGLYTPLQPLLVGTMRQKLLDQKLIKPIEISINHIHRFKKIHFINALNPLGCQSIDMKKLL
jgi:4-amino-4-deoxychorismate lyase